MSTRYLSELDWISQHGSGSLQYAVKLECHYKCMYFHERIAFTFGPNFDYAPNSRVQQGTVLAEPDCKAFTESCWNIRRLQAEGNPLDKYSNPVYLTISKDNETIEGIGVVLTSTDVTWLPKNHTIFAIIAPVKNKQFTGEINSL